MREEDREMSARVLRYSGDDASKAGGEENAPFCAQRLRIEWRGLAIDIGRPMLLRAGAVVLLGALELDVLSSANV